MPPVFGNYHGYYTKRPFLRDPRLALLPSPFFIDKTVLDVGCNEGWVTCEIAHAWGARHVLGVDIDDTLVRAAWKRRRTLWSLQSPLCRTTRRDASQSPPKRVRLDPENTADPGPDCDQDKDLDLANYFPASCEQSHGPLPIPANAADVFPHNVAFRTTDWVTEDATADTPTYDVVIAFSITKWIHLNHGDEGLTAFFRRAHCVLKPGGTLLLEPQSWETYGKARRMDPRLKENARRLRLRPDDFSELLAQVGFGPPQRLGVSGEGGFHRPVDLYTKK